MNHRMRKLSGPAARLPGQNKGKAAARKQTEQPQTD